MIRKLSIGSIDIIIILCFVTTLLYRMYWLSAWLITPYIASLVILLISKNTFSGQLRKVVFFSTRILIIITYSIICKLYVFDIYRVSGESMEGTLKTGDVVLINKLAYGSSGLNNWANIFWFGMFRKKLDQKDIYPAILRRKGYSTIKRNAIVVYELYPDYFVVKRCIGLPGDIVQLKNDSVYINNRLQRFNIYTMSYYRIHFSQQKSFIHALKIIPQRQIISFIPDSNDLIANLQVYQANRLTSYPGIGVQRILNALINGQHIYFLPKIWTINNMGPLRVPFPGYLSSVDTPAIRTFGFQQKLPESYRFHENFYFMMGDNKTISEDSRYLGFVPEKNILGKVSLILYSKTDGKFSWKRFLAAID